MIYYSKVSNNRYLFLKKIEGSGQYKILFTLGEGFLKKGDVHSSSDIKSIIKLTEEDKENIKILKNDIHNTN